MLRFPAKSNRRLSGKNLLLIGVVDLGGSRWRLVVARSGKTVVRLDRPAVPPARLFSVLAQELTSRGLAPLDRLVIGSKGIWTNAERNRLWKKNKTLARDVWVMSDVELAMAATFPPDHAKNSRSVFLVAGTGSIALGRDPSGRLFRAGGRGPRTGGDPGSGFWLGREYLKMKRGLSPQEVRRLSQTLDGVRRTAAWARKILNARGPFETALVKQAQNHLAQLVVSVFRRMGSRGAFFWSGGGSLLLNRKFRLGVARQLAGLSDQRGTWVASPRLLCESVARRSPSLRPTPPGRRPARSK